MKRKNKIIDGLSESAWKSLAIKSLRIGWPNGIRAAENALNKSTVEMLLVCGLFEDVFPQGFHGLNGCITEIKTKQYEKLCQRDTHHGRNFTTDFCKLREEACNPKNNNGFNNWIVSNTELTWVNPRVNNCIYTWNRISPSDKLQLRPIIEHEFVGMPNNILDGHTYEGKKIGREMALLSGHYENHQTISDRVLQEGWEAIQNEFYLSPIVPITKQEKLF